MKKFVAGTIVYQTLNPEAPSPAAAGGESLQLHELASLLLLVLVVLLRLA